ncbi:MAG: hypothetical protein AAGK22_20235 [Acidobacteriota bacterium]
MTTTAKTTRLETQGVASRGLLELWPTALLALLVLVVPLLYLGIDSYGYLSMEAMVLEGANNMLSSGDWLVPRLYGEIYTYKPPLGYWLGALPAALSEGAPSAALFRLPFVTSVFSLALLAFVTVGCWVSPRAGLWAGVGTVGSVVLLEKVRLAEFDTPLTACVGGAVLIASATLVRERRSEAKEAALWTGAYAFLYLGFLAKGVPALMSFVPGLLLAALLNRRGRRLLEASHLLPAITFAALVCVYVWSVVSAVGWEGFSQPAQEAQAKGFNWGMGELALAVAKPLIILAGFAPFSLFVPRAAAACRAEPSSSLERLQASGLGFLAGGILAFTAVPTHEMRYYLPLAAAFGLAGGLGAEAALRAGATRFESIAIRALALLVLPMAAIALHRHFDPVAAVLLALLAAATIAGAARQPTLVPTVVTVATAVAVAQSLCFVPARAASRDLAPIAELLEAAVPLEATLWTAGPADTAGKHSSLYAALGRTVRVFDPEDPAGTAPADGWFLLTDEDWRRYSDRLDLCDVLVAGPEERSYRIAQRSAAGGCSPPVSG